jgi:hypothetical protein
MGGGLVEYVLSDSEKVEIIIVSLISAVTKTLHDITLISANPTLLEFISNYLFF